MPKLLTTRFSRLDLVLLITNILGVIIYLWRVRYGWAIPAEKGMVPITGEPFIWTLAILPIITVFPLLDIAWGTIILVTRQWRRGRVWSLAVLVWFIAVVVDFAHH